MQKLLLVAGARPNFMKVAPIIRAIQARPGELSYKLVHTGQHYDEGMSEVFFRDLGIPKPDHQLNVGSGSHADQTARIMLAFEPVLLQERPDWVVVVGDVNSTLACSIVAKKLNFKVAHVEAGLRSGDLTMPEEINRIVTDSISDLFFVTEQSGVDNLLKEGKSPQTIHFVGHVMIDNLLYEVERLGLEDKSQYLSEKLKHQYPDFGVVTLHRPSNVDDPQTLSRVFSALEEISGTLPLIFPIHPRTRQNINRFGIRLSHSIVLTEPLGYRDFLNLWMAARLVLTDSGGLQEETTALGVPCVTLRDNTERPITVSAGTNLLAGNTQAAIVKAARYQLSQAADKIAHRRPELWDGKAACRVVERVLDS